MGTKAPAQRAYQTGPSRLRLCWAAVLTPGLLLFNLNTGTSFAGPNTIIHVLFPAQPNPSMSA